MDVYFCKGGLSMLTRCKKALALVALAIFLLPCAALAATPDYPDHFAKYPAYKLGSSSTGVANYFDPATITCQSYDPPNYALSASVIMYSYEADRMLKWQRYYFKYNYAENQIWVSYNGSTYTGPIDTTVWHLSNLQDLVVLGVHIWEENYGMKWKNLYGE